MNARPRFVLAALVLALISAHLITPVNASAQGSQCCSFVVDNRAQCDVRIGGVFQWIESDTAGLVTNTTGVFDTLGYGVHQVGITGKGCSVMSLAIQDWNDNYIAIPMSPGQCLENVRIGPDCAARICFAFDPVTGCPLVRVLPLGGCKCG